MSHHHSHDVSHHHDHEHSHGHGQSGQNKLSLQNEKAFDELAPSIEGIAWIAKIGEQITKELQDNIEWVRNQEAKLEHGRLLDYACGGGVVTRALAPYFESLRGIDISAGMLKEFDRLAEEAGHSKEKMRAVRGDLLDPEGTPSPELAEPEYFNFDTATMSFALHHVEDVEMMLRRLVERVRPGGTVVIIDLVGEDRSELPENMGVANGGFTKDQMQSLFEKVGLEQWSWKPFAEPIEMPIAHGGLVTSSSKGLAEITKSEYPSVKFIHESVRDFLVKEKGLQAMWPDLGFEWQDPGHERLKGYCEAYLHHRMVQGVIDMDKVEEFGLSSITEDCPFFEYVSQEVLYHADAAADAVPQADFLARFFTKANIMLLDLSETAKVRRYSLDAPPIYILADKGLANLLCLRMAREPADSPTQERYRLPLFAALANGRTDAVAAILGLTPQSEAWSDFTNDEVGKLRRIDLSNKTHLTPLSWAAENGKLGIVKVQFLVEEGADINARAANGKTPLLSATRNGHRDVAELLIDKGADLEAESKEGETALLLATRHGLAFTANILTEKGANVHAQAGDSSSSPGYTALMHASIRGQESVANRLIMRGADMEARSNDGETALMHVTRYGRRDMIRFLVKAGARVNAAKTENGQTARMLALHLGQEDIAELLVKLGAYIYIPYRC